MRKILISIIISTTFTTSINAKKSGFEIFGDIMQALPAGMAVYSLAIRDYDGVLQLALGAGSSALVTHFLKSGFSILAYSRPDLAYISRRPTSSYEGFPSGHTSFAFSAAGYAYRRYGYKAFIPVAALAALTGASRVYAGKHTIAQVVAGGALGFVLSWAFAKEFDENNMVFGIGLNDNNGYMLNFRKAF